MHTPSDCYRLSQHDTTRKKPQIPADRGHQDRSTRPATTGDRRNNSASTTVHHSSVEFVSTAGHRTSMALGNQAEESSDDTELSFSRVGVEFS